MEFIYNKPDSVKAEIQDSSGNTVDSIIESNYPGKSIREISLKLPPLKPSRYYIKSSVIENNTPGFTSVDTIDVVADNSEIRIPGFKHEILDKFSSGIDIKDTLGIKEALLKADFIQTERKSINFNIRDNIWILSFIILLLLIEWFLKKIWETE